MRNNAYKWYLRATSAIIALAASGCLVVCGGTAAELAADESSTKTDEGWSTQVRAGDARSHDRGNRNQCEESQRALQEEGQRTH